MTFYNGKGKSININSYFEEKRINLIDKNKSTENKLYQSNGSLSSAEGINLTDFIEIDNSKIYYTNCYVNSTLGWQQKITEFDESKNFISNGQISEMDGYGKIIPSSNCKYIRISYANTIDPCLALEKYGTNFDTFINLSELDIKNTYKEGFINNTLSEIEKNFLKELQRMSSKLYGKKAVQIGDSNTQYMGTKWINFLEEEKGLTLTSMGTAGATWEVPSGEDSTTTKNTSAVGKVNQLIANADSETKLCTDYDIIIIMMGTNCGSEGETTDTSSTVTTMCGAMRYCLEKLCYYYRKSSIGVILPAQRDDGNVYQEPRNEKIKSICAEYSVPVFDLYHAGRIVEARKIPDGNTFSFNDGLHFGDNGLIHFFRIISAWLETI